MIAQCLRPADTELSVIFAIALADIDARQVVPDFQQFLMVAGGQVVEHLGIGPACGSSGIGVCGEIKLQPAHGQMTGIAML